MKNYIDYLVEEVDEPEFPKIMICDSFRGYLKESIKKKFCENSFDLAGVVPMDGKWWYWTNRVIIQSFKKCGISNFLNELEDIENNDVDEIIKEVDEELMIEVNFLFDFNN
ncbi:hypothetical protein C1646_768899 [Rhizophagus diaphanus]|nr:hypothetical protein C1646_768899 [Rhizophagus diaphanus] [Rhizophagus sp. MUCL 43196]